MNNRLRFSVVVAFVGFGGVVPQTASAQSGGAKANYDLAENGVYFYASAPTREQEARGALTGDAIGYRYYGKNEKGEHIIVQVNNFGQPIYFIYCLNPCKVIRYADGSRIANNSQLLLNSVFLDAARGKLRDTNPEHNKMFVPDTSPLSRQLSGFEMERTERGGVIIRGPSDGYVRATADGIVSEAGTHNFYRLYVKIVHGGGIETVTGFLHGLEVAAGDRIHKGDLIGVVRCDSRCPTMEVNFEVRIDKEAVDPRPYLESAATSGSELRQPLPPAAAADLTEAVQRLAANQNDAEALLLAGRASLRLEDFDAAMGFFTRARDLGTTGGRAKAGLAAALVYRNMPNDALRLFAEADAEGDSLENFVADYGLALDLLGDNVRAQTYYRNALRVEEDEEITRRLAISQAIGGDQGASEMTLLPLLQRQDLAAYRARAFALAALGRTEEAVAIAEAVMPASLAARIAPFLRNMPRLTRAQQAAAANFGHFPKALAIGKDDPRINEPANGDDEFLRLFASWKSLDNGSGIIRTP